jgi:UDP-N-acetylglucosamine 2-epimerase
VDVRVIACASALLERYGRVVEVVRADFPEVAIEEVWSTYEGANLLTSAHETGALLCGLTPVLHRLQPGVAVVCADRHEVLAAAQAAAYQHVRLVHLQGGERTGSIDDRVRDAITQLSSVHCVCTTQARLRVYALTGDYEAIHVTGCPSIDLAREALSEPPVTVEELGGSGADDRTDDTYRPIVVVYSIP